MLWCSCWVSSFHLLLLLWPGAKKVVSFVSALLAGSSSGLHHDFHDNMYVLLRGSKRFRLYSPSCVADMYVRGTVNKVYPNGRIVYEGQGDILPDGSGALSLDCLLI